MESDGTAAAQTCDVICAGLIERGDGAADESKRIIGAEIGYDIIADIGAEGKDFAELGAFNRIVALTRADGYISEAGIDD